MSFNSFLYIYTPKEWTAQQQDNCYFENLFNCIQNNIRVPKYKLQYYKSGTEYDVQDNVIKSRILTTAISLKINGLTKSVLKNFNEEVSPFPYMPSKEFNSNVMIGQNVQFDPEIEVSGHRKVTTQKTVDLAIDDVRKNKDIVLYNRQFELKKFDLVPTYSDFESINSTLKSKMHPWETALTKCGFELSNVRKFELTFANGTPHTTNGSKVQYDYGSDTVNLNLRKALYDSGLIKKASENEETILNLLNQKVDIVSNGPIVSTDKSPAHIRSFYIQPTDDDEFKYNNSTYFVPRTFWRDKIVNPNNRNFCLGTAYATGIAYAPIEAKNIDLERKCVQWTDCITITLGANEQIRYDVSIDEVALTWAWKQLGIKPSDIINDIKKATTVLMKINKKNLIFKIPAHVVYVTLLFQKYGMTYSRAIDTIIGWNIINNNTDFDYKSFVDGRGEYDFCASILGECIESLTNPENKDLFIRAKNRLCELCKDAVNSQDQYYGLYGYNNPNDYNDARVRAMKNKGEKTKEAEKWKYFKMVIEHTHSQPKQGRVGWQKMVVYPHCNFGIKLYFISQSGKDIWTNISECSTFDASQLNVGSPLITPPLLSTVTQAYAKMKHEELVDHFWGYLTGDCGIAYPIFYFKIGDRIADPTQLLLTYINIDSINETFTAVRIRKNWGIDTLINAILSLDGEQPQNYYWSSKFCDAKNEGNIEEVPDLDIYNSYVKATTDGTIYVKNGVFTRDDEVKGRIPSSRRPRRDNESKNTKKRKVAQFEGVIAREVEEEGNDGEENIEEEGGSEESDNEDQPRMQSGPVGSSNVRNSVASEIVSDNTFAYVTNSSDRDVIVAQYQTGAESLVYNKNSNLSNLGNAGKQPMKVRVCSSMNDSISLYPIPFKVPLLVAWTSEKTVLIQHDGRGLHKFARPDDLIFTSETAALLGQLLDPQISMNLVSYIKNLNEILKVPVQESTPAERSYYSYILWMYNIIEELCNYGGCSCHEVFTPADITLRNGFNHGKFSFKQGFSYSLIQGTLFNSATCYDQLVGIEMISYCIAFNYKVQVKYGVTDDIFYPYLEIPVSGQEFLSKMAVKERFNTISQFNIQMVTIRCTDMILGFECSDLISAIINDLGIHYSHELQEMLRLFVYAPTQW